ncbi:MAG: hypothetical protein U0175_01405 [Caldilineaceae bacterium]
MRYLQPSEVKRLFLLLILSDFALILVHLLHKLTVYYLKSNELFLYNPLFAIETDLGLAESFQYVKEFWIVLMLCALARRHAQLSYLSWGSLFFYILLDDAGQIHERLGRWISSYFHFRSLLGLGTDDMGQLSVYAAIGLLFLFLLVPALLHGDKNFRNFSLQLGLIFTALTFCGAGIDAIYIANQPLWVRGLTTLLEEGGEMIVMSVAVAYLFGTLSLTTIRGNTE